MEWISLQGPVKSVVFLAALRAMFSSKPSNKQTRTTPYLQRNDFNITLRFLSATNNAHAMHNGVDILAQHGIQSINFDGSCLDFLNLHFRKRPDQSSCTTLLGSSLQYV